MTFTRVLDANRRTVPLNSFGSEGSNLNGRRRERPPQAFDLHSLTAYFAGKAAREQAVDRSGVAGMSTSITVRNIDPGDKSWLRREARRIGVSMEELVRRLIHEKRAKAERCPKPSEAFARHFGERRGVDLPPPARRGYEPLLFSHEDEE